MRESDFFYKFEMSVHREILETHISQGMNDNF